MLLISFVLWQTYNNLDLMYIANKYHTSIKIINAYYAINDKVEQEIKDKDNTICTLNAYPVKSIDTKDYNISIKYRCLRKPLKNQVIPKESKTIEKMFIPFNSINGNVSNIEYEAIQKDILALEVYEFSKEIIGPWLGIDDYADFVKASATGPIAPALIAEKVAEEVVRREEISRMERYLIFDCYLEVENVKKQIMYIYNAETNQIENKIVT